MRNALLTAAAVLSLTGSAIADEVMPGRAYMRPDGLAVLAKTVALNAATNQLQVIGLIIQLNPGAPPVMGNPIIFELNNSGDFKPANLCYTQPRGYVDPTSGRWWREVDRYVQYEPCPATPIE